MTRTEMMSGTPPQTNQARIYLDLRRKLESGAYPHRSRLPSIRDLATTYQSSKGVLQLVINRLQLEKLITTEHGRGLFAHRPTQIRRVLLLNPTSGHEWSDYTSAFIQLFSLQSDIVILLESADAREPRKLDLKIHSLMDEGIDTILFNGLTNFELGFISKYQSQANVLCFYDDTVIAGRDDAAQIGRVVSDWRAGGEMGMKHLIKIGCRHVALISHSHEPHNVLGELRQGIRDAIAGQRRRVKVTLWVGHHESPDYADQFEAFLRENPDVDGIFAESDVRAARLLPGIRRAGRSIPDDIAILGYYNTPWADSSDPPISSICTNPAGIAEQVVDMIVHRRFHEHHVVEPMLIVRESTTRGKTGR